MPAKELPVASCPLLTVDRFGHYPARLRGDSAYGSAEMLGWMVYEHGIEPHVTVFDKLARKDGTFSRGDFTYDRQHNVYRFPGATALRATGTLVNDGGRCSTLRFSGKAGS